VTAERPARPVARAATGTRRERAVARSVDPARVRAEKRLQRFLDAALELLSDTPGAEFTVQEVVERSGQSLRSFYQYFAGKHELLLALFEESVRSAAEHLRTTVERESDPVGRLRRFTVEYYRLCNPRVGVVQTGKALPYPAIAEFAQRLLTEHPREAARAYQPLVVLLEELLRDATAAGRARRDLRVRRLTGVLLQAIMFNSFAATISSSPLPDDGEAADELWQLIVHGISVPASGG
jgi:AcrR family transcriptional regulator